MLTSIVVVIFAVVKFTAGAWLILIIFPVGVFALIRLNREYRTEARVLENLGERRASGAGPNQPNYSRRVVIVFVDDFDLSTVAALRYAKSLRPTTVRPCTSSSTASRRNGCAPPGCPTATSRSSSSTALTGGWPGPRPNWPGTRRKHQARR